MWQIGAVIPRRLDILSAEVASRCVVMVAKLSERPESVHCNGNMSGPNGCRFSQKKKKKGNRLSWLAPFVKTISHDQVNIRVSSFNIVSQEISLGKGYRTALETFMPL